MFSNEAPLYQQLRGMTRSARAVFVYAVGTITGLFGSARFSFSGCLEIFRFSAALTGIAEASRRTGPALKDRESSPLILLFSRP